MFMKGKMGNYLVLVSCGCCKKVPQTGWLRTAEIHSLSFGGRKFQIWMCGRAGLPLKAPEKNVFHAFLLAFGGLRHSLAPRQPSLPYVSSHCVRLCVQNFLFYKDTSHVGLGAPV